jgi:hypothetical protein
MPTEVTYSNRYKDQIKFELVDSTTIKITGYSPYYRMGWPNVYDKAYEAYVADNGQIDIEEFKKIVHDYKNEKMRTYSQLVYSDQNTIDMWDPSGGPYLAAGQDMREFFRDSTKPLIIKEFKTDKDCVLIKLED